MKPIIVTSIVVGASVLGASIYYAGIGDFRAKTATSQPNLSITSDANNNSEKNVVETTTGSMLASDAPREASIPDDGAKETSETASESLGSDLSTPLVHAKTQDLRDFLRPDDISELVFQGISRRAVVGHEDDQAAQLSVIRKQLQGYRDLKAFKGPDGIPDKVARSIARKAMESHPDDFSGQFDLITNQLSAYGEMQGLERPADIPVNVFRDAVQDAVRTGNPTNYSALLLVIRSNLKKYRQDQPPSVPQPAPDDVTERDSGTK